MSRARGSRPDSSNDNLGFNFGAGSDGHEQPGSLPHKRALWAELPTGITGVGGLSGTACCPRGPGRPQVALAQLLDRGQEGLLPPRSEVPEVGESGCLGLSGGQEGHPAGGARCPQAAGKLSLPAGPGGLNPYFLQFPGHGLGPSGHPGPGVCPESSPPSPQSCGLINSSHIHGALGRGPKTRRHPIEFQLAGWVVSLFQPQFTPRVWGWNNLAKRLHLSPTPHMAWGVWVCPGGELPALPWGSQATLGVSWGKMR